MKVGIGILLIVGGIALGLYAGLWWAFVGGIMQIIAAVQATPIPGADIAWGIVKIVFAGAIGGISAFVLIVPGMAMLTSD